MGRGAWQAIAHGVGSQWVGHHWGCVHKHMHTHTYNTAKGFREPNVGLLLLLLLSRFSRFCLCDPIDGSPTGSPVPRIFQARILEWVAISFSKAWKWKVKVKSLNRVRLLETLWTAAYQAPPSMGFSRQEYWSRVPLPSPKCWLRQQYKAPSVLKLSYYLSAFSLLHVQKKAYNLVRPWKLFRWALEYQGGKNTFWGSRGDHGRLHGESWGWVLRKTSNPHTACLLHSYSQEGWLWPILRLDLGYNKARGKRGHTRASY